MSQILGFPLMGLMYLINNLMCRSSTGLHGLLQNSFLAEYCFKLFTVVTVGTFLWDEIQRFLIIFVLDLGMHNLIF
jgi:hypothetical protein